jgi:small subunit ribosomal protein S1
MSRYVPGGAPCDERYWQAVLREGEFSRQTAPPLAPYAIWQGFAMEAAESLPPSAETAAEPDDDWEAAFRAMESGTILELRVTGYNRGGVLVDWDGRQGFVPVSHLSDISSYLDEKEREQALRQQVGKVLRLHVIEVHPERSRLVLSERATRADEACRRERLDNLKPGDVCSGRVTNLCSFGAFVDLGGLEGLVHISEISWGRVDHPAEVLTPGQPVRVMVLNIDRERGRVGLSIKRTQEDPWRNIEERYSVGQLIDSVITNVVDFGAFAQVEEGIEGLVHVSELAEEGVDPHHVVKEGQRVQLRVIHVDSRRRRLGLSLRQALPAAQAG